MKRRPYSRLAFKNNISLQQHHQFLRNGQTQTETFLSLSTFQTGKSLKYFFLFFRCHAAPRICHGQMHAMIFPTNPQFYPSFFRKFQGITKQIIRNLPHPEWIAAERSIKCPIEFTVQFQSFFLSQRLKTSIQSLKQLIRIIPHFLNIHFIGLQTMKIKQRSHQIQ